jgi:hypothetical protein
MFMDTHARVNMKREVGQSLHQRKYSKEEWWPGPPAVQPWQAAGERKLCVHRLDVHWPVRDGYRDSAFNHVPLASIDSPPM